MYVMIGQRRVWTWANNGENEASLGEIFQLFIQSLCKNSPFHSRNTKDPLAVAILDPLNYYYHDYLILYCDHHIHSIQLTCVYHHHFPSNLQFYILKLQFTVSPEASSFIPQLHMVNQVRNQLLVLYISLLSNLWQRQRLFKDFGTFLTLHHCSPLLLPLL